MTTPEVTRTWTEDTVPQGGPLVTVSERESAEWSRTARSEDRTGEGASPSRRTGHDPSRDTSQLRAHDGRMDATVVLGRQGRVVIPARVREALGLAPGDHLHLRLVGHSLVLKRPQDAAAELRGLAASVPRSRSLVEELLKERRLSASAGE